MLWLVPEVHLVVQHCHLCQVKSQKAPKQKDVHHPSVQAGAPFQVWSMDILGPLRISSEGNKYLLMLKGCLQQMVRGHPTQRHNKQKGTPCFTNVVCPVWSSITGTYRQRNLLPVSAHARSFPWRAGIQH